MHKIKDYPIIKPGYLYPKMRNFKVSLNSKEYEDLKALIQNVEKVRGDFITEEDMVKIIYDTGLSYLQTKYYVENKD